MVSVFLQKKIYYNSKSISPIVVALIIVPLWSEASPPGIKNPTRKKIVKIIERAALLFPVASRVPVNWISDPSTAWIDLTLIDNEPGFPKNPGLSILTTLPYAFVPADITILWYTLTSFNNLNVTLFPIRAVFALIVWKRDNFIGVPLVIFTVSAITGPTNCIINMPKDKLVVLQGLDNYIVVESEGILLICKKEDEQEIKQYVNEIKLKLGDDYL